MKKTVSQVVGYQLNTQPTGHLELSCTLFRRFIRWGEFGPLPATHAKVPRIPLVKRTENRKTLQNT